MMTELKSSDYEHLILTFDKYWGWHVTLEFDIHPSSKRHINMISFFFKHYGGYLFFMSLSYF